MVFIVALHAPWSGHLKGLGGPSSLSPSLQADNLKCTTFYVVDLCASSQYAVSYVQFLGKEASSGNCVLPSTTTDV